MAIDPDEQDRLRLAIFADVELMSDRNGGYISRADLLAYSVEGRRIALIDPNRGIRNPADFDETLAVVNSLDGPYPDRIGDDGLLRYAHRAGDLVGGDNRKLRRAMDSQKPIIIFRKPAPNVYVPILPAYVVGEDRRAEHFVIAADSSAWRSYTLGSEEPLIDRRYVAQMVRRRVHQPVFRAQVIVAYASTCAVCRLRHPELLDAAHIVADREDGGIAHVTNGMALCKIHHSAYDNNLLGVSPDYRVHVNAALMREVDGPMLKHGIQEMDGAELTLPARPSNWPSRERLSTRFDLFTR